MKYVFIVLIIFICCFYCEAQSKLTGTYRYSNPSGFMLLKLSSNHTYNYKADQHGFGVLNLSGRYTVSKNMVYLYSITEKTIPPTDSAASQSTTPISYSLFVAVWKIVGDKLEPTRKGQHGSSFFLKKIK